MGDGLQQVGLAQPGVAVDEQRVVLARRASRPPRARRRGRSGSTRRDEGLEGVAGPVVERQPWIAGGERAVAPVARAAGAPRSCRASWARGSRRRDLEARARRSAGADLGQGVAHERRGSGLRCAPWPGRRHRQGERSSVEQRRRPTPLEGRCARRGSVTCARRSPAHASHSRCASLTSRPSPPRPATSTTTSTPVDNKTWCRPLNQVEHHVSAAEPGCGPRSAARSSAGGLGHRSTASTGRRKGSSSTDSRPRRRRILRPATCATSLASRGGARCGADGLDRSRRHHGVPCSRAVARNRRHPDSPGPRPRPPRVRGQLPAQPPVRRTPGGHAVKRTYQPNNRKRASATASDTACRPGPAGPSCAPAGKGRQRLSA